MREALRSFASRQCLVTGIAVALAVLPPPGVLALGGAAPATVKVEAKEDRPPIKVIAHRGGAMNRPENTMPAFRHSLDLGVEIVEFDMLMTADDRVVVYHDDTINSEFCSPDGGSGAAPGPVRALTAAQTRQFDCGSRARPSYTVEGFVPAPGARIPSLDEVLGDLANSNAIIFAETKIPKAAPGTRDIDPVKFASLLNDAVRKHGLEDRVILQSFDFRTIDALHELNPRICTCLLGAPRLTQDYLPLLRQHHASCIVLSDKDVDRDKVGQLQSEGVLVSSGVVDSREA